MFSQMGAGQQMAAGYVGDSFGIPGASGMIGSTGQGTGVTGDNVPQTTTGGLDTDLKPSGASGEKQDDNEMKS
jgi:hypothetical protein